MKPLVILLTGADPRWLGSSVRARNIRVAERVGADLGTTPALETPGDRTAVLVPSGVAISAALFPLPALSGPTWLASSAGAGRILGGPAAALAQHLQRGDDRSSSLPTLHVAPHAILDTSTRAARRTATRLVLLATTKPTDGWISRHCNRPISRVISRALLTFGLSAHHASALTLIVGLAAAFFAAQPGPLTFAIAGLLFHLASVVDGVDGEMARATVTESKTGARVDTIVDNAVTIACLAGISVGWIREGGGRQAIWWSAVIALLVGVGLVRSGLFVSRYAPTASFVFVDQAIRRAARTSGSVLLRGAARAFTAFRRDVFAVVFMAIGLTGRRIWVPILLVAGGLIANITFALFSRELASAGQAEAAAAAGEPAASTS